jgi:hypothetical protein
MIIGGKVLSFLVKFLGYAKLSIVHKFFVFSLNINFEVFKDKTTVGCQDHPWPSFHEKIVFPTFFPFFYFLFEIRSLSYRCVFLSENINTNPLKLNLCLRKRIILIIMKLATSVKICF